MGKIYFSIKEANQQLPEVRKSIERLREIQEQISVLQTVQLQFKEFSVENELMALEINKNYHQHSVEFFEELRKLTERGCIVKDVAKGNVDFYSKLRNQDIFLCWHYGEEKIQYWHECIPGKNQRKNIQLLEQEYSQELEKLK